MVQRNIIAATSGDNNENSFKASEKVFKDNLLSLKLRNKLRGGNQKPKNVY